MATIDKGGSAPDVCDPALAANRVPSRAFRWLERLVLGFALLVGLSSASTPLGIAITLPFAAVVTVLVVTSPAWVAYLCYRDASWVRAEGEDWRPRPWLYAVAGVVLSPLIAAPNALVTVLEPALSAVSDGVPGRVHLVSKLQVGPPLVAVYYLYRRHQHVEDPVGRTGWWWVLPITVAAGLVTVLLMTQSIPAGIVASLVSSTLFALFPLAAYQDAAYVRSLDIDWSPNPATHFLLAYASVLVTPLSPLYPCFAGYYLLMRRRHVGVP